MPNQRSDEVRRVMVETMGDELGENVFWLSNSFTNLNVEFRIYRELFASQKERVDAFNKASGLVAYYVAKSLLETVLLGLSRITDPAESGRGRYAKKNLSLATITTLLPIEFQDEYSTLVDAAKDATRFARDWRNLLIAHADLFVVTREETLNGVTVEEIENALEKIEASINYVNGKLRDTTTFYSDVITGLNNEHSFLRTLYLGNKQWEENLALQQRALEEKDYKQLDLLKKDVELPEWVYQTSR